MGLDNGIVIKVPKNFNLNIKNDLVKVEFNKYFDDPNTDEYEIAYWRKCWGLRNAIINKFHFPQDCGEFNIDLEDIPVLIKIISKFHDKTYWEEDGDSIWEYEEINTNLMQQIINLVWLYELKKENSEIKIEFYDSY